MMQPDDQNRLTRTKEAKTRLFDYDSVSVRHLFATPHSKYTYVSPNAEYLPIPPSISDELHSIHSLGQPRYAYDTYFYLALVPLSVEFDGPLLGCLSPTGVVIEPIKSQRGHTFFHLRPHLQSQWQSCEAIVLELQRRLTRRAGIFYLETTVPPPPSAFGYSESYHSRQETIEHLKKALSAFTARLAFISYLALKEQLKGRDPWTELALEHDPIPLAVCNAFRLSWVCDWTIPRVGAFVDIGRHVFPTGASHWHQDLRLFLSKGTCVPLWFAFTLDEEVFQPATNETRSAYEAFRPLYALRKPLADAATKVFDDETSLTPPSNLPWNLCYSAATHNGRSLPSTLVVRRRKSMSTVFALAFGTRTTLTMTTSVARSHSSIWHKRFKFRNRQLCGETYEQFMQRQEEDRRRLEACETTEEREARKSREERNASQPVPTGCAPAVYLWEFVASYQSLVRNRVPPGQVGDLWKATSSSSRVYNAFRDEYDVLLPVTMDDDLPFDNTGPPLSGDRAVTETPLSPSPLAVSPTQLRLSTLVENVLGSPHTLGFPAVQTPTVCDTLRYRYGYVGSAVAGSATVQGTTPSECDALHFLCRATGTRTSDPTLSKGIASDIAQFISSLRDCIVPPAHLFDLADAAKTKAPQTFIGVRLGGSTHAFCFVPVVPQSLQSVQPLSVCVLIRSATSVLHAHRLNSDTSREALVDGMLSRGVQLEILRSSSQLYDDGPESGCVGQEPEIDGRPIGMGVLPHGLQLTQQDYAAYHTELHQLLSGPLGIAALQAGGILWRLARGVRQGKLPVQEILHSDEGAACQTEINGVKYRSRAISRQHIFRIVGTYRIQNASSTEQASIISWWPHPDVWAGSEMDVGFWSSKAELWFQKRCTDLRLGKAKAKTNHVWRKDLKRLGKDADNVLSTIEHYSRLVA